ncbi:MAG TPA: cupin domain-containing protein [Bryobacteraceae bacterium]|nr:cupin domain-containing protein [Bryobacteraceae bacterium]
MIRKYHPLLWLPFCAALFLSAQEKQPATATSNFTGTATRLESNIHVRAARIHFDPGARTKWHIHERGQVLLCQEGVARTQVQGHPVRELHAGDTAYVPGGVPHWHGAAPGQGTTLFSVDVSDGKTKWLGAVTDTEYNAVPKH